MTQKQKLLSELMVKKIDISVIDLENLMKPFARLVLIKALIFLVLLALGYKLDYKIVVYLF